MVKQALILLTALAVSCSTMGNKASSRENAKEESQNRKEAVAETRKSFSFIQLSDPQLAFHTGDPSDFVRDTLTLDTLVRQINRLRPPFVIVTGDMTDNSTNKAQLAAYRKVIDRVSKGIPVYHLPGNHDVRGFSREKQAEYIALRGYDHFSFQDRGCAFIGIDTNCIKDGAEEAEAEQWAWLEKELAAAKDCRYTFVFLHCPVIRETLDEPEDYFNFSAAQRRKYIDLFKQAGVDVVFAGHTHQEYDTEIEGIRFVAAGPVGNALGHGTPGYNVVQVGVDGVDVTFTPTPGIDPTHCRF